MISQITKGVKISVETHYEGCVKNNNRFKHAFSYFISIENTSHDSIFLKSRYWEIFDALNPKETVVGEGVVGLKPTIKPGEIFRYQSGVVVNTPFASMKGYFRMFNLTSTSEFKVYVPSFKLNPDFVSN
jgi:ApaG protein